MDCFHEKSTAVPHSPWLAELRIPRPTVRYTRLVDCWGPAPLTLHSSRVSCNGHVVPLGARDRIVSLRTRSVHVARTWRWAWVQAPAPLCAGRALGQPGPSGAVVFCLNGKGRCASGYHLPNEETEPAQPCHSGALETDSELESTSGPQSCRGARSGRSCPRVCGQGELCPGVFTSFRLAGPSILCILWSRGSGRGVLGCRS